MYVPIKRYPVGFLWCYDRLGNYLDHSGCEPLRREASPLTGGFGLTGISFTQSQVDVRRISDGTSNTYLMGEKSLPPLNYGETEDGEAIIIRGDLGAWCASGSQHTIQGRYIHPRPDRRGGSPYGYGSAHDAGFNMAFCDGSVRLVDYDIDPQLHLARANRNDGLVVGNESQ
jgi:prepilin-type processing-associated H-X9-DG protein